MLSTRSATAPRALADSRDARAGRFGAPGRVGADRGPDGAGPDHAADAGDSAAGLARSGRNLALAATLLYLFEGAIGLPVFAPVRNGLPAMIGPTAGYLWTFPVAAYAIGVLLDRGWVATYAGRWAAIFLGTAVVFAGGAAGSIAGFHLTATQAFAVGVAPFIVGDVLKVSIAAALPSQAARIALLFGLA